MDHFTGPEILHKTSPKYITFFIFPQNNHSIFSDFVITSGVTPPTSGYSARNPHKAYSHHTWGCCSVGALSNTHNLSSSSVKLGISGGGHGDVILEVDVGVGALHDDRHDPRDQVSGRQVEQGEATGEGAEVDHHLEKG